MRTDSIINELIASDDAEVEIPAQNYISSLAYISFLVRCMKPVNQSPDSIINTGVYSLVIDDTKSSKLEINNSGDIIGIKVDDIENEIAWIDVTPLFMEPASDALKVSYEFDY